ncbi:efflux RND transporter periplasmic adaptor subunit [uncultured Salinisphaera sp.]|uniref:efflux RND transporter periplasmic adaptor subunit n=1 Tax=uncultured Salinisphaera sp. TaxID=359372 RepID=UPI0032B14358
MKNFRWFTATLVLFALAIFLGYEIGSRDVTLAGSSSKAATDSSASERKVLYWKAPMDANFRRDQPGKSPMGMDLVPVYASEDENGESSDVKISPAVVNNLGVRTEEVQHGALSNRLETVGYVTYDEDTITSINTRADGWVEKLAVKTVGSAVDSGQMLYELFSPKLETAQREYQTALKSGSQSLIAASRQRMRSLGFTANQIANAKRGQDISDRVSRRAPTSGVVVELNIREGAYVQPATQVMKLADLSKVWVQVEIDEGSAALIEKGQPVIARFEAFPGQQWKGTVDYIYPAVDEKTRTVKVRVRFDNPDRKLQPNMYAHVTIRTASRNDAVIVPQMALIRTGQSQRVIVALGDGRFDVCPVEVGASSGNWVEILAGLQAGQRVVTSAQFMLDSEANVDAAALRLGNDKPGCTAEHTSTESDMASMSMPNSDTSKSETAAKTPSTTSSHGMSNMNMGTAAQIEPNKAEQP